VLDEGRIVYIGQTKEAISYYLNSLAQIGSTPLRFRTDRRGTGEVRVVNIEIKDTQGNSLNTVCSGQDIDIFFHYETTPNFQPTPAVVGLLISSELGIPLISLHNRLTGDILNILPPKGAFVCHLRRLPLAPSNYYITYSIRRVGDYDYFDYMENAIGLTVIEGDFYGTGEMHPRSLGFCLVDCFWEEVK
jgi:lipopolysaccharide transport system ATP-binding protein